MSVKPVCCSLCRMWDVLEAPGLPDIHICEGCVELRFLRDRVKELELQLEDLRLVRENEEVIDKSYRQVVTPGPREDKWVTARKGKARVIESTPVDVPLHNKHSCLSTAGGDSPSGGSSSGRVSGVESGPVIQRAKKKEGRRY